MTENADLAAATDPELISLVRAGDARAYDELFVRHRDIAVRYAGRIADPGRAEDLCAEAFAKIFDLLQRGLGPDVAFRAYLLTTVRTSHLNTIRARSREELVPDHEAIARQVPVVDDPDNRFDQAAIHDAFAQLPRRWRAALWLTTVEGLSNEEAGEHLGIKPNAVASLAFRARAGLRQAYLSRHLLERRDPRCRRVVELLPSHVRGTLTPLRRKGVDEHLAGCSRCTAAALELNETNARLRALFVPLVATGFTLGGAVLGSTKVNSLSWLAAWVKGWAGSATSLLGVKAAAATVAAVGLAASIACARGPGSPTR